MVKLRGELDKVNVYTASILVHQVIDGFRSFLVLILQLGNESLSVKFEVLWASIEIGNRSSKRITRDRSTFTRLSRWFSKYCSTVMLSSALDAEGAEICV